MIDLSKSVSCFNRSSPLMPVIFKSVSTRSKCRSATNFIAASPELAVVTSYPSPERIISKISRWLRSSSTTKIDFLLILFQWNAGILAGKRRVSGVPVFQLKSIYYQTRSVRAPGAHCRQDDGVPADLLLGFFVTFLSQTLRCKI
jgi:hypothetical protein